MPKVSKASTLDPRTSSPVLFLKSKVVDRQRPPPCQSTTSTSTGGSPRGREGTAAEEEGSFNVHWQLPQLRSEDG